MSSEHVEQEEGRDISAKVHSANSWETADLGGKERNEKFLRLMGANKKEHHGKIVIGDNKNVHKRDKTEEHAVEENLTEQFQQGMEHRLVGGRKGHLGLGFHSDSAPKEDDANTPSKEEDNDRDAAEGRDEGDSNLRKNKDDWNKDNVRGEADGAESEAGVTNQGDNNRSREKDERKRESLEGLDSSSGPNMKKMKFVKSSS